MIGHLPLRGWVSFFVGYPGMVCDFKRDNQQRTRLYRIWDNMNTRCSCPSKGRDYERYYGGKGIRVCDAWKHSFEAFRDWALEHGYAENLQLDRIDSDGNYTPENCRWVTAQMQAWNRSNSIRVVFGGVEKPLAEWVQIFGLDYRRAYERRRAGWDVYDMLFCPCGMRRSKFHKQVVG